MVTKDYVRGWALRNHFDAVTADIFVADQNGHQVRIELKQASLVLIKANPDGPDILISKRLNDLSADPSGDKLVGLPL